MQGWGLLGSPHPLWQAVVLAQLTDAATKQGSRNIMEGEESLDEPGRTWECAATLSLHVMSETTPQHPYMTTLAFKKFLVIGLEKICIIHNTYKWATSYY